MLRAGMTVYAIITDHPNYPKVIYEDSSTYGVHTDRATAQDICDAWNSYHSEPARWPFYVLETVVLADEHDEPVQLGLFGLLAGDDDGEEPAGWGEFEEEDAGE